MSSNIDDQLYINDVFEIPVTYMAAALKQLRVDVKWEFMCSAQGYVVNIYFKCNNATSSAVWYAVRSEVKSLAREIKSATEEELYLP